MYYLVFILIFCCTSSYSQTTKRELTLGEVIDTLSLLSSSAKIEKLIFQNEILQFSNYKKKLLPSISFDVNPVSFNHSLKLLQQPSDGSYTYVEDYTNNSTLGLSLNQKIGLTGGNLKVESTLNYLNEFSLKEHSFSTTPFAVEYSQQFWGGGKMHKLEKLIENKKYQMAIKKYCSNISQIQKEVLVLFMATLLHKLEYELALQNQQNNDTLLYIAKIKLDNGNITEYDFNQIELQSLETKYTYEHAVKSHNESLQRLLTFLKIKNNNVDISSPDVNLPITIDFHSVIYYTRKNNPFSSEQELMKMQAQKDLHSVKISNKFNGSLSLSYGTNQHDENFINAYQNSSSKQSIIIGMQIPIFQWGINRNNILIAENNFLISSLTIAQNLRNFENEIKEKVNNYNRSLNLWLLSEKLYKLSKEQYRMLVQKFSLGKVAIYELTTAQEKQNTSMQQYYSTINDVYRDYFTLRHMTLYDFKTKKELEDIFVENL